MSHFTIALVIVGALVLILGTVVVVRAYLKNRLDEMAPFRDYFGAEYVRDLIRQSSWCDDESPYVRQNRIDSYDIRDRNANEQYLRGSGATWWKRNRD
jgi:hypothetical protein